MAGLDLDISMSRQLRAPVADGRVKPGHDGGDERTANYRRQNSLDC
jgi:hypothetical protein